MFFNRILSQAEFLTWLSEMDKEIINFIKSYPVEIQEKINFSVSSLDVIEQWIIDNYPNPEALLLATESQILDRLSRYVGETFARELGCKWIIEIEDPDPSYAYNGIPRLSDPAPICPTTIVTASADRRTGIYMRKIFENMLRKLSKK